MNTTEEIIDRVSNVARQMAGSLHIHGRGEFAAQHAAVIDADLAELRERFARLERLRGLCERWNKMAAHFAAGSEFINDPERVLEALRLRERMEMELKDRRQARISELEQANTALSETVATLEAELQREREICLAALKDRATESGEVTRG